ncbi:hypothetical protein MED121_05423 [Marinomonas sp. MED121]|uniref:replication protein P n=1 Tax=Marinomonas sp. MED121 TaxID=314277 RepID=UPI000068FBD3|nr:replication protein P [Marinomonas sp. MED121]EAQ63801.1 hypothetical protein MED121_05423 [Marinomonas sp. MED121]
MHSQTSTTQTGNSEQNQQAKEEAQQQTRVLVNMLFARFKAVYTHKFASAYANPDEVKLAKREWAIAIKGFKEPLLAYAVERSKETYAWPPTIAEFLQLIAKAYSAYGLNDPRSAYLEACQCRVNPLEFSWSHPAVYHAGATTGWYSLKSDEEAKTWPAFEKNYSEVVDLIVQGQVFEVPSVPLIENQQEDITSKLIPELIEKTGLPEGDIACLLYYLKKTKGTQIRARYRAKSQADLEQKGFDISLPE